jgi:hypothetical protein
MSAKMRYNREGQGMAAAVGIVQHFWHTVPAGFAHVGALIHELGAHGLPTVLGFIGF